MSDGILWVNKWTPSLFGVFPIGPQHLQEGSALNPSIPGPPPQRPPAHLKAQVESFLLIHSHRLHLSASLEKSLTACLWDFSVTSISWNSLDVKVAMPTSTTQTITFQPRSCASVANSAYLSSPFPLLPMSPTALVTLPAPQACVFGLVPVPRPPL